MCDRKPIVTIDGPSGGGKSTVSRMLADKLGFTYLDTGAMYRAVAFLCREQAIEPSDAARLESFLATFSLDLMPPAKGEDDVRVVVADRDIGHALRSPEMGMLASRVSALPLVRKALTRLQQLIGEGGRIVAEGRDTGTVVFPDAAWKFYLDASPEIRAQRRAAQLRGKGETVDEHQLLAQIIKRDKDDRERTIAPLVMASDGILIDTTSLHIDEVIRRMHERIKAEPCDC